jgi:hypothetical protein
MSIPSSSSSPFPRATPASKLLGAPGLAERAGHAFSPQACVLGFALFTKARVSVELLDDDAARLLVRGQKTRTVTLRAAGTKLFASCSCAPESVPLAPCRHLWASLLELGRREAFPALRATRGAVAVEADASAAAITGGRRAAELGTKSKAPPAKAPPAKAPPAKAPPAKAKARG